MRAGATFLVCSFLSAAASPGTQIVVCEDGQPRLPIVAGSVSDAVRELDHYLTRITGAHFEIVPARRGAVGLYVGCGRDFPWLGDRVDRDLGPEGFLIESDKTSVFLVGREPRGVRHAVVTFLHSLGCRWFFPGAVWEIVPQKPTLADAWHQQCRPSFPTQRSIWYGYGAYTRNREEKVTWDRHNRLGGRIPISIGHTWYGLDPEKDFAEHPSWFALTEGARRPTKPCFSHPAVAQRAISTALRQADGGGGMISLSPPDGLGYCECERCMAVLDGGSPKREHGTLFAKRPDGRLVNITSETLFRFVNTVAERVAAQSPTVLLGCYAYSAYSHPPSFDLHPNVYLQTTTAFRRTPLSLEEQIAAFGKRTRELGIREYYSVYQWDWDGPPVTGSLELPRLVGSLRSFREKGVTAVNAEASNNWAARGLGYYIAANLLWDVRTDVPALVRDFYEKAFGPAAPHMERYFVRWYGPMASRSDGKGVRSAGRTTSAPRLTKETLTASFADLSAAAHCVADVPGCRERVDHIRLYLHYLFLRHRLEEVAPSGDAAAILRAVEAETVFGARLLDTNMIHARPLIGKAFHRRFRKYAEHLALLPDGGGPKGWGKGFRVPRHDVPARKELERLWSEDRRALGLAE